MRNTPTDLQMVMFDPLAYIHPQRLRLPAGCDAPAQRASINRMLLDSYRLPLKPPSRRQAEASAILLRHWLQLPQIAFLLGCQRLRLALSRRGLRLRLPPQAQAFMALPLLQQAQAGAEARCAAALPPPDYDTLAHHGLRQLALGAGGLPPALALRVPLLFAPSFDRAEAAAGFGADEVPAAAGTPDDALVLAMAIQHVKRYPTAA